LVSEGGTLLPLNIWLPEPELETMLTNICAGFGTVKFIRLLPIAESELCRFAFVQMSSTAENMDLSIALSGSTLGSGVVALRLEADMQH
jgi:hypothetical protein